MKINIYLVGFGATLHKIIGKAQQVKFKDLDYVLGDH